MINIRKFAYEDSAAGAAYCIETIDSAKDSALIESLKSAADLDEGGFSAIDEVDSCN